MCDLVQFVQFKKLKKHRWRGVIFSTKSNTPPLVFLTFFKLYKWYQTTQSITYNLNIEKKKQKKTEEYLRANVTP